MEHWLDKKFEDLKKTDISASDEEKIQKAKRIKANFEKNRNEITAFILKLKELFGKLELVKEDGFEYYSEFKSIDDKPEYNMAQFSGENSTQHPTFLRRFCIYTSEEEGMMQVELYRGKRDDGDKPWKFHDEQIFPCEIAKLDEERAYELIDWFAWKIYTPRGLR